MRRTPASVHGARAHRRYLAFSSIARALTGRERLGAALRELREFEVELDGVALGRKQAVWISLRALRRLVSAPDHAWGLPGACLGPA